jgi:hypothetical protein
VPGYGRATTPWWNNNLVVWLPTKDFVGGSASYTLDCACLAHRTLGPEPPESPDD